ncbi:thermonuclease family protein [Aquamicrobium sp.]|uniref:thermonuclease family protein n=1 Tax=Aquamicrobium sp. TaxID=1872579 RepID=UPI00258B3090|nr:thermonuclease family protein [Aquamicrobium sp.]MCK9549298.1 thermonuclease family protein [Aquamicrobium sp.]
MKYIVFLFLAATSLLFSQNSINGLVVGVSDGDTLKILDNSKTLYKIRLAEIDAPEKTQDYGQVSKKSLSDICYKKQAVAYVANTDRYGRSVATVYCNNQNANQYQVTKGMAWVYRQYSNNPSYIQAEQMAKRNKIGLWNIPNPIAPWEYRRASKKGYFSKSF